MPQPLFAHRIESELMATGIDGPHVEVRRVDRLQRGGTANFPPVLCADTTSNGPREGARACKPSARDLQYLAAQLGSRLHVWLR